MDLAALQARAASTTFMASDAVPILHGRTLYLDGDGLAYYCAGNDETTVAEARSRVSEKVEGMRRASGAGKVTILLTGSGGHKGHRYAVARVKPYQGQRANSRRPKNWQALREMLEQGLFGDEVKTFHDREADDAFGQYGHADPANTVHGTQDKDMRMVPGWHIDWKDNRMFYLPPDAYEATFNDKLYGLKWFWSQMLQGDTADFIPGLPKAYGKLCGEVGAAKILAGTSNNAEAANAVAHAYKSHYAERWLTEMLEQAVLLWMRRGPRADWFDCAAIGGPLYVFHELPEHHAAWKELSERIDYALELNALAISVQAEAV